MSSCNDGEDDELASESPIVGTWKANEGALAMVWESVYLQFKNNGAYTAVYVSSSDDVEKDSGKWRIDGDTLYITVDGETSTGKITKLSDNELILKGNYDGVIAEDSFIKVSDYEIAQY